MTKEKYKELFTLADKSFQQLLFFYELTRLGIVRFDLNNQEHVNLLNALAKNLSAFMRDSPQDRDGCVQRDNRNRKMIYMLTAKEIQNWLIPKREG